MMRGRKLKRQRRSSAAAAAAAAMATTSRAGLERISLLSLPSSRFQKILDCDELLNATDGDDKDCILSQDFFCTPDYLTPEGPQISNIFSLDKENACPKSPEKSTSKRRRIEGSPVKSVLMCDDQTIELRFDAFGSGEVGEESMVKAPSKKSYVSQSPEKSTSKRRRIEGSPVKSVLMCDDRTIELRFDAFGSGEVGEEKMVKAPLKKSYVSQSAVALRCRALPPPCTRNPYLDGASQVDLDIFEDKRLKSIGFSPLIGGDGLSRYRTDFHEIEQIGCGNFSHVFKVLNRLDGCMYAVKQSIRQLHHDFEWRHALMEVQALASLGSHENIIGYHTSWFENHQLYIQMELCERSLSIDRDYIPNGAQVLEVLHQMAKALHFIHERGIAHLDVKPDNIYVKNNSYKLGDFGCATRIDRSLPIEEGDSRYMPQEMLNDQYEHLNKVDIFSLGAAIYELVKGSPLPDSGPQFLYIREGRLPLLPGHSMQFQALLKAMMNPDPMKRPSAKEIMENPIFEKAHRGLTKQSRC